MKMKKSVLNIIGFSLIVLIISFSAFTSFAVRDNGEAEQSQTEYEEVETTPEVTEYIEETDPPETEYVPETYEQPEQETEAPETEAYEGYEDTEPVETFAVLEDEFKNLPKADTTPAPTAVHIKKHKKADMTYGIVSWVCVVVGVLTVIIVILSNKSGYYGGSGKQRYDEGNKITGQKRLLNDDYYTNRKYNNYRDRDNYR